MSVIKKKHKLVTWRSGAQSSYINGRCECGEWHYQGWTTRVRDVKDSYKAHLARSDK